MTVSGDEPDAAGRADAPRILFVAQHLPVPVRGGSSQRSHILIEMLSRIGEVEMVAIGGDALGPHLERHGYTVAGVVPASASGLFARLSRILFPAGSRYRPDPAAEATLRKIWDEGRFDLAVGRYLGPSARVGVHRLPCAIVDIDDLESQKLASWARQHRLGALLGPLVAPLVQRMAEAERRIIGALRRAWVSAPEDRAALESSARLDVVPNIPFGEPVQGGPSSPAGPILFVASFDYRVNANALRDFLDGCWPRIRTVHPDAVLRIVGGGLGDALLDAAGRVGGVEVAGFVDDLAAEYARAAFSIVPIWEGGGTKIKILESLAYSRTCVVAAPSMRGYRDSLGSADALLVADDGAAFETAVSRLLTDDALRHRLERQGFVAVQRHYGRDRLADDVRRSVEAALCR